MSNITPNQPTRTVTVPVSRVTFDLVPRHVVENLFYLAINFVWASDEEEYHFESETAKEMYDRLQDAVSEASHYTVEVMREAQEPI